MSIDDSANPTDQNPSPPAKPEQVTEPVEQVTKPVGGGVWEAPSSAPPDSFNRVAAGVKGAAEGVVREGTNQAVVPGVVGVGEIALEVVKSMKDNRERIKDAAEKGVAKLVDAVEEKATSGAKLVDAKAEEITTTVWNFAGTNRPAFWQFSRGENGWMPEQKRERDHWGQPQNDPERTDINHENRRPTQGRDGQGRH